MGETEDPSKEALRGDIDQIRIKLDETLKLYKQGEIQEALTTSRSAYLDSYEEVGIPLRPIDPDFTLDMEIKFAQLRNLLQSNAEYDQVLKRTSEIKSGLIYGRFREEKRFDQFSGIRQIYHEEVYRKLILA